MADKKIMKIEPGTPQMEQMLQAGYPGMSVAKAKTILKERKETPTLWPYEVAQQAEAFLEAYSATPRAISTRQPKPRELEG